MSTRSPYSFDRDSICVDIRSTNILLLSTEVLTDQTAHTSQQIRV